MGELSKFINLIHEYSHLCLVIRVDIRCRAAVVIDTNEEMLKLYPLHTHLRMDNGSEFIANALQESAPRVAEVRLTSHRARPGTIYSWNRSTAN